jgi:GT2 family glycosyltransferase
MIEHPTIQCKKVAVVVLGYNSLDYIKAFLPSVVATDYDDFTTVYVDNASVDDSVEYVKSTFPQIEVFRIYENHGFTNGYEESLPHIKAEYYVLINSDVKVEANWLAPMMKLMEADPTIGACQPKVIHQPSPPMFDHAGASGGYLDQYGYAFCRGRLFHEVEDDTHQYDDIREIFWATGACMLTRAELYHGLGGLDNDFYAHMEEIDLCWRMKNAGYKLLVVPEGVVYHVGGSIITYGSFTKIFHNYRNNLIMMYKNLLPSQVWSTLIIRLILDQIAAIKALISGNWTEWRAILAADFQFISKLAKWRKNRREAQQHVNTPNLKGMYKRSIVLDVFLKKKKKFSELDLNYFE